MVEEMLMYGKILLIKKDILNGFISIMDIQRAKQKLMHILNGKMMMIHYYMKILITILLQTFKYLWEEINFSQDGMEEWLLYNLI